MGFKLAVKSFIKAWKDSSAAEKFLETSTPLLEHKPRSDLAHLRLLGMLQKAGRLIDFLKEDIAPYTDAQVGAAARAMHGGCAALLEELVTLRPVMVQAEGERVRVEPGYDSVSIKVIGKVMGEPPFEGTLVHGGWKAHKQSLPKQVGELPAELICPAEVEVKGGGR